MQAKRKAAEDQSADGVATDLEHGDAVEVMTSHPMQAYKFVHLDLIQSFF
jgi:hypothetical protein